MLGWTATTPPRCLERKHSLPRDNARPCSARGSIYELARRGEGGARVGGVAVGCVRRAVVVMDLPGTAESSLHHASGGVSKVAGGPACPAEAARFRARGGHREVDTVNHHLLAVVAPDKLGNVAAGGDAVDATRSKAHR